MSVWGNPSTQILEDHFNLCFWNIHKIESEKTLSDLVDLKNEADIVLVQEAVSDSRLSETFTGLFAKSWGKTGVATLSDVEIIDSQVIVSHAYELGVFTPKVVLISEFQMNLKKLMVANVHALNFVTSKVFELQMKRLAEAVSEHNGPIIVAGDFNTWNKRRIKSLREIFSTINLHEIDFYEPTIQRDPRMGLFGLLDRAFVRGLKVRDVEIRSEIESSDHLPSCAHFEI